MKILILSDSHEKKITLDLSKYDYVFHAGDYGKSKDLLDEDNAIYVMGNCDFYGDKEKILTILDKTIYLTHGDLYRVKYQLTSLYLKAKEVDARLCIFGHTHEQYYSEENNIIFLNPGAYNRGAFVEIIDDEIRFYQNEKLIKKFYFNL